MNPPRETGARRPQHAFEATVATTSLVGEGPGFVRRRERRGGRRVGGGTRTDRRRDGGGEIVNRT